MSRRVVWSADARQDVHELVTYASEHDPEFAERLYDEIDAAAHALATYDTGRPGRLPGTREKSLLTRRLILSYGIVDEFPAIPGFAESWGKTVIHCPFCHGYEVAGTRWGLLYSSPMSLHGPVLYANWTDDITLILDGHEIIAEERSKLDKRGVRIVDGKLAAIHHQAGRISGVAMEDGTTIGLEALYAHPRNRPSADLHLQLGLDMKETPTGSMIAVGDMQVTSRPGIFAAGDLVTGMHSVTFANNTGSIAAMGALQSLMV